MRVDTYAMHFCVRMYLRACASMYRYTSYTHEHKDMHLHKLTHVTSMRACTYRSRYNSWGRERDGPRSEGGARSCIVRQYCTNASEKLSKAQRRTAQASASCHERSLLTGAATHDPHIELGRRARAQAASARRSIAEDQCNLSNLGEKTKVPGRQLTQD